METRTQDLQQKSHFDVESFLASYTGDISLTPDGLHYLGMAPRPNRPHLAPFPLSPLPTAPRKLRAV